jgi:transposase
MPRQYSPEFRQRALRMLQEAIPEHVTETAAIEHVASRLGVVPETLRKWRQRYEIEAGLRPGSSSEEQQAEIRRLKRENAELRRANEILKTASAFLLRSSTAPRRDDPVHRSVSGQFRGRADLLGMMV